ncbi:hypothetical protein SAMN02745146_0594 [Hymenobacter daecheongensis DSM 21074]|uniref:SpoIIAA-like n=1 Tax=Hymenobacter daecheongensis DSM 21074 TaxID=1121955 RepID=A0A1M6ACW6_9BACT|nr:hypothetical protein [Hymenobacter daecheongensis]SHI34332.1 hypothetical protein SAMN02745146_0594 [Hymenobacter daecheongensis DSM 21074]
MILRVDSLYFQYDISLRLVRWQWHGSMDLLKFQRAFEGLADFSRQHHISKWLADTSDMPLVGFEEQVWLGEQWLPQFARLGVYKIGLVLPLKQHNALVVEHLMFDEQHYMPSSVQFFSDAAAALDWLTDSAPGIAALEQEWQANYGSDLEKPDQALLSPWPPEPVPLSSAG